MAILKKKGHGCKFWIEGLILQYSKPWSSLHMEMGNFTNVNVHEPLLFHIPSAQPSECASWTPGWECEGLLKDLTGFLQEQMFQSHFPVPIPPGFRVGLQLGRLACGWLKNVIDTTLLLDYISSTISAQRPRTDLNKIFLPTSKTTTAWKLKPQV
jgi:hypothetical protein